MLSDQKRPNRKYVSAPSDGSSRRCVLDFQMILVGRSARQAIDYLLDSLVGNPRRKGALVEHAGRTTACEKQANNEKFAHEPNCARGCAIVNHTKSLRAGPKGPPRNHKIELVSKGNRNGR